MRSLTRRTAVRIRFADDDRFSLQLRNRSKTPERYIDGPKLSADSHADMAIGKRRRRSLRVKRQEIQRRADLACRMILPAQAVLEKILHELAAVSRRIRTTNTRRRQRPSHTIDRVIVQLPKLLRRSFPVT